MTANEYMKKIKDNLDSVEQNLEQIQCDDCISRQAVLERREILKDKQGTGYQAVKTKYIRELPSVNPQEPKTGNWIFDDECKEHGHCSHCGYGKVDLVDGAPHNYCPNCGAKMVEPQESEDKK